MDIHEYLGVLRRGIAIIVLGVLVGIIGALGLQSMQVPSYSASSRELLTTDTSGDLTQSLQASSFAEGRIASYVLVASSGLVLQPVIDELGLDMTVEQLASQISVVAPPATLVIQITATSTDPQEAMDIANATSRAFSEVVATQLESGVVFDDGTSTATPTPTPTPTPQRTSAADDDEEEAEAIVPIRVVNIESATLPGAPTQSTGLLLLVGAFLGLALGLVGASVREALDRRIRTRRDIVAVTSQPVIGDLRADRAVRSMPLVVAQAPASGIAENFRVLRTNLEHLRVRDNRHSFVITAMGPGQGATTVTANLALAVASAATTVVVVDADFADPALSKHFEVHPGAGLADVLAGRIELTSALRATDTGVHVLPAGSLRANPGAVLAGPAMRAVLAELRERFDVVLIDAPSIGTSTDATVLGSFGSATLLVVAAGAATRPGLTDALAALSAGGSVPAGLVLNHLPRVLGGRRSSDAPRSASRVAARPAPRVAPAVAFDPVVRAEAAAPAERVVRAERVAAPAVSTTAPRHTAAAPAPAPVPAPAPAAPAAPPVVAAAPVVEPVAAPVVEPVAAPVIAEPAPVAAPVIEHDAVEVERATPAAPGHPGHPAIPGEFDEGLVVIDLLADDSEPVRATAAERAAVLADVEAAQRAATEPVAGEPVVRAEAVSAEIGEPQPQPQGLGGAAALPESAQVARDVVTPEPATSSSAPRFGLRLPRFGRGKPAQESPRTVLAAPPMAPRDFPAPSRFAPPSTPAPVLTPRPARVPTLTTHVPGTTKPKAEKAAREAAEAAARAEAAAMAAAQDDTAIPAPKQKRPMPAQHALEFTVEPEVVGNPVVRQATAAGSASRVTIGGRSNVTAISASANRERQAREAYLLKTRELERAARERLVHEQRRLEARIREQLEQERRLLGTRLDDELEDTVITPRTINGA